MKKYFLAVDEGTTGTRALIYDKKFNLVSYAYTELMQYTVGDNGIELDFDEIYDKTVKMCKEAMDKAGISADEIIAMGITHQRNTQGIWDKKTGRPLLKAISWQDTRSDEILDEERAKTYVKYYETSHCGREFCESSTAIRIKWLMDRHPDIAEKMRNGEVAYGCVGSWLVWKLTEGAVHAISYSSISSLNLYDFIEDGYCRPVIEGAGIPESILPEIKEEVSDYGTTTVFGAAIPITALAGDQQASMFAQNCRHAGEAKCTNGTGTFMDIHLGDKYLEPKKGMLTMVAWSIGGKKTYVFEGQLKICGTVIQWFRDGLGIIDEPSETEALAASVKDSDGVIFCTTLAGSISPDFDPAARGAIFGIHTGTKKAHIVRAALEGIAFGLTDLMEQTASQAGIKIKELKIDGGTSRNNIFAQALSDFNQCKVYRTRKGSAATGAGIAQMASIGAGVYNIDDVPDIEDEFDIFKPEISEAGAAERISKYREAIKRSAEWAR